ncbi:MAG: META domain-containing protein, partial [Chloroflexi bacterium]|nr:META domain-containing protein [Chloroflexota bacterium]
HVSGTGGCNTYSANIHLAADAYLLLLNTINHSFDSCTDAVNQLETTFFRLMETAESFTLENDTLTIYATRGTLSFTKNQTN